MERLRNGLSSVQNPWAQEIYDLLAIRKLQEERRIREQKEREQRAAEGLLAGALLMSLMLD